MSWNNFPFDVQNEILSHVLVTQTRLDSEMCKPEMKVLRKVLSVSDSFSQRVYPLLQRYPFSSAEKPISGELFSILKQCRNELHVSLTDGKYQQILKTFFERCVTLKMKLILHLSFSVVHLGLKPRSALMDVIHFIGQNKSTAKFELHLNIEFSNFIMIPKLSHPETVHLIMNERFMEHPDVRLNPENDLYYVDCCELYSVKYTKCLYLWPLLFQRKYITQEKFKKRFFGKIKEYYLRQNHFNFSGSNEELFDLLHLKECKCSTIFIEHETRVSGPVECASKLIYPIGENTFVHDQSMFDYHPDVELLNISIIDDNLFDMRDRLRAINAAKLDKIMENCSLADNIREMVAWYVDEQNYISKLRSTYPKLKSVKFQCGNLEKDFAQYNF